jgi:Zn-dependent protease
MLTRALRLFRLWGINVYVHWTWLPAALFLFQRGADDYASPAWAALEYLTLFGIVLLHEFGHALACRSVGGKADRIVLWPLGGVAFVQPPQRAGAYLWSIAAGPLVNVALLAPTIPLALWAWERPGDLAQYVRTVGFMNVGLLVFNLLPFFPLDGGQIVRAVLWWMVGRARSLIVAGVIGMLGAAAGLGLALVYVPDQFMLFLLIAFAAFQCWGAVRQGLLLRRIENAPRFAGFACPRCNEPPPAMVGFRCPDCGTPFQPFPHLQTCPNGCARGAEVMCLFCMEPSDCHAWLRPDLLPPRAAPGPVEPREPSSTFGTPQPHRWMP